MKLSKIDTDAPKGFSKEECIAKRIELSKRLGDLQHLMYAEGKHSLLVVFQGMDASGKDGTTKKVFRYCSPSGTWAYAFKKPTDHEFAHDFLWRCHKMAPHKGHIQIFNRSHYEDVLIQRVHKWISEEHANKRIDAINAWEDLLQFDNGTTVLKFYMHISEERQLEKLQERIDIPRKNWKHNPGDWEERKHWKKYMDCYQDAINKSTIPWTIVPSDKRWYRDYFVAKHMVEVLESFDMKLPPLKEV